MSDVNDVEFVTPEADEARIYGPLIMCVEDHMRPPTQGVMLSELVRGKHKYAYEVLGCKEKWLIPFFDWESYRDTPEELARAKWVEWEQCISKMKKQFGDDVNIVGLDACGKKGDRYIVSFHVFVRGVGAYRCGKDMVRAGIVPDGFDMSVYKEENSRQLFRMAGMSKAGDERPFRWIAKHNGEWASADIWKMDETARNVVMRSTLAQYSEGERHIEVARAEAPVEFKQTESGRVVALGMNGEPFGEDIKITADNIRPLCVMAGWFQESDRSYERWRDEMWMLQNTADDNEFKDGLDGLMMEVSAVCAQKHTEQSVLAIKAVSMNRPTNMSRKHLGDLRKEARAKNEGAYLLWLESVKVAKVNRLENNTESDTKAAARVPYLFMNHNAFVGKSITRKTADAWLTDALIMVMNGGDTYFLTRNKKVCEITNRPFEVWHNVKAEKLLRCLDVSIKIKNIHYDPKIEREDVKEFDFCTFGPEHKKMPGYVETQIYQRKVPWVDHEDFIPFLTRRVPDPDIARAVKDKTTFNKFRGFPIEEAIYQEDGPKFLGSRWHHHLMHGICHGDMHEWKHLEATMADMIQRPYRISNVSHVFQGSQGTGKSFLHKFMSELLGAAHTMLITDMGIYTQKFNEDQGTAILKVFEEVRGKGDQFINNDRLKADITKLTIRVEIKNGAILTLRHCARYWMLTNHRDTLHIEADCRRYVYHSVSNAHANDWDYFAPIVAELKDIGYLRACFEYFAELEYDEKFVMTAISTSYKNEQKLDSMPLTLKFLRDMIENNMLANADPMRIEGDKVYGALIYELYGAWCMANNHQRGSAMSLVKAFAVIGLTSKGMRINGAPTKGLVINPTELRDRFREHFKMPSFDWSL